MTDTSITLTEPQKDIARHALGLDGKRKVSYRNHFVTGPGTMDYPYCMEMVEIGAMRRRKGDRTTGGDDLFTMTLAGATAALLDGERLDPEDFAEGSSR